MGIRVIIYNTTNSPKLNRPHTAVFCQSPSVSRQGVYKSIYNLTTIAPHRSREILLCSCPCSAILDETRRDRPFVPSQRGRVEAIRCSPLCLRQYIMLRSEASEIANCYCVLRCWANSSIIPWQTGFSVCCIILSGWFLGFLRDRIRDALHVRIT